MRGVVEPCFPLRASPGHRAFPTRTLGGVTGEVYCDFAGQLVDPNDPNNCIFRDSLDPDPNDPNLPADLRAAAIRAVDVERIVAGAAERANHTRAAIRRPIGTPGLLFNPPFFRRHGGGLSLLVCSSCHTPLPEGTTDCPRCGPGRLALL